jgi:DNA modification methylase
LNITDLPINDLIPYARNPRKNDGAVDKVAASIKEFGWRSPIVVDEEMVILAGHTRYKAAQKLKLTEVPVHVAKGLSEAQKKAYRIADNRVAEEAEWDFDMLKIEIEELGDLADMTGLDTDELEKLLAPEPTEGLTDEDAVPEVQDDPISKEGDVWILGRHRVMCGDSTSVDAVEKLTAGNKAALLHADPPYGMGKEGDGVANDNLYREKLDEFQMEWWATFRTFLEDNASAYIWGNAPDLWRLWYRGGLGDSEDLQLQNEIVWAKPSGFAQSSALMRSYAVNTERCLFFLIGVQGYNDNADNYWEGWEPLRKYLADEKQKSGLTNEQIKSATNSSHTHYWTTSQWHFPTKEHYQTIQKLAKGDAFKREYDDLKREYDDLKQQFYATRAHFDNTHDNMNEVWDYGRVTANERHGHATPKPVAMMERVMRSSLPKGGICLEPFAGSGSTLMGAEKTGRICYTMELQGKYVDVIIRRWQDFTGQAAIHEETGVPFNEMAMKEAA